MNCSLCGDTSTEPVRCWDGKRFVHLDRGCIIKLESLGILKVKEGYAKEEVFKVQKRKSS